MHIPRTVLYAVYFLMVLIQKSHCETGICGDTTQPVIAKASYSFTLNCFYGDGLYNLILVKVCTDDKSIMNVGAYIDTASVPTYQTNECMCTISPSSSVEFIFTYKVFDNTNVKHMWFEISDQKIDRSSKNGTRIKVVKKTDLLIFITTNLTNPQACLNVSTEEGVQFNITCNRIILHDSTSTLIPSTSNSTRIFSGPENKGKSDVNILIPIVATTAGVVCISVVTVVIVIVICRRKSVSEKHKSDTSTAVVDKENEDGYYMTDNPMYNVDDSQPNIQSSEREYHCIEPDNKGDRMSSNQYDSMPDLPVKNQSPNKQVNPDLHYDYSTCSSAGQKYEPGSGNGIDKNRAESNGECRASPNNKPIVNETMYDRTDIAVEMIQTDNEYHHINPAASRKRVAMDTYNTIGNANYKHKDN